MLKKSYVVVCFSACCKCGETLVWCLVEEDVGLVCESEKPVVKMKMRGLC